TLRAKLGDRPPISRRLFSDRVCLGEIGGLSPQFPGSPLYPVPFRPFHGRMGALAGDSPMDPISPISDSTRLLAAQIATFQKTLAVQNAALDIIQSAVAAAAPSSDPAIGGNLDVSV